MKPKESEYRLYGYILDRLKEVGWDTRTPAKGGKVYTQNEALQDANLKRAFGQKRPEYVVLIDEKNYWVIEAKASIAALNKAVEEAKARATQINRVPKAACKIISGVCGSPDTTHYVETRCLTDRGWEVLKINHKQSTGFLSPSQVAEVLSSKTSNLREYELNNDLFYIKIKEINTLLHNGAVHKKSRAEVLACLLLALANDPKLRLSEDPTTLIRDINTRAQLELEKYGKANFFQEIEIKQPTSRDNPIKYRNALTKSIEKLRDINIASTINSGRDVLRQCAADNTDKIVRAIKNFMATQTVPEYSYQELDCSLIAESEGLNLSAEDPIGKNKLAGIFDIRGVIESTQKGVRIARHERGRVVKHARCGRYRVVDFLHSVELGKSGREKGMTAGDVPLISTAESNNGIAAMVNKLDCAAIYAPAKITISKNGGCCYACFHDYRFAANSDVFVAELKQEFRAAYFAKFLCAAINQESWRYNYYKKLSRADLDSLLVDIPVAKGSINFTAIEKLVADSERSAVV